MNKNSTFLYLAILALLALVAYFTVFRPSTGSSLDEVSSAFAVADTAAVTKIDLMNNKKRHITLVRQANGKWRVNTYFNARPDAITNLLRTMKQLTVKSPVSNAAQKQVSERFQAPLKTVKIFTDNPDEPFKVYYIGGTTPTGEGTYMQLEGASEAYIMHIHGHLGSLIPRYFTYVEDWRDRIVFDYKKSDIKEVAIDYKMEAAKSFVVKVVQKDSFVVNSPANKPAHAQLNKAFMDNYLQSFQKLYAEAFENTYPKIDSIKASTPYCTVAVTNQQNVTKQIQVHYMPVSQRTKKQFDSKGKPMSYDSDRYFAFINKGNDLIMIQDYVFGKIFVGYDNFALTDKQ
jgi:hypothetical protein